MFECDNNSSREEEAYNEEIDNIIHFFVYFDLGHPFHNVASWIHLLQLNEHEKHQMNQITNGATKDSTHF